MRYFQKFFAGLLAVCLVLLTLSLITDASAAPQRQFVRLHVRANSDTAADQRLKLAVRDAVLRYTTPLMQAAGSKAEAIETLQSNLGALRRIAANTVRNNGYDDPVDVRLCREYFEYRSYDGFFLPAGDYDALIVTIGQGAGHNWWCALYPAVCLSGATEEVQTDLSRVPDALKTAQEPSGDVEITFGFWILDALKSLFA